jgi:hypothetical protein
MHEPDGCLACAWNEATAALPDRKGDFLWLEGPMQPQGGAEFYRATFIGWLPMGGRLYAESESPERALTLLAKALHDNSVRILMSRAQAEREMAGVPMGRA